MIIVFEGKKYSVGLTEHLDKTPWSWNHVGSFSGGNLWYPQVFETPEGLVAAWQPINSQWRVCARMQRVKP